MRFNLSLRITSRNKVLPINYQYPLHSWIYNVIQSANAEFSKFLHDDGYRLGNKKFKLFTFSGLQGEPFRIYKQEQRIGFYGEEISLQISFYIDQAAEYFITGLFKGQSFSLGDHISQVDFEVIRIEAMPRPSFQETMQYQCITPVVISYQPEGRKQAKYYRPEEEEYEELFIRHLVQKHASLPLPVLAGEHSLPSSGWKFKLSGKSRRKGVHIKQHTPGHTQVIGYRYNFGLTAPVEVHELGYYAGFGEKNSLGFGMVGNRMNS